MTVRTSTRRRDDLAVSGAPRRSPPGGCDPGRVSRERQGRVRVESIAFRSIVAETGGQTTGDLKWLPYVRRPRSLFAIEDA